MVLGVEEVRRAQVPIADPVGGLDTCGVDRQLDRGVGGQVEPALEAVEVAFDGQQAPKVPGAELDSRALRVKPPSA